MIEELLFRLDAVLFWLAISFDFLLLLSLIFALFYLVTLVLSSLLPPTRGLAPRAWGLPLLLGMALAATLSAPGELAARAISGQIIPLMIKIDLPWLPQALIGLWFLGAGLGLARLGRSYLGLKKALAGYQPVADDPALAEALTITGFSRPVDLKLSARGSPAASWGLFRSVIVVPEDLAETFDLRERLGIYLHEIAHIESRDSLKYVLMSVLGSLMWFNPLVGRAIERYKCHLEITRDRQVAGSGRVSPVEYARLITKCASRPGSLLSGFSGDYQSVVRRFSYIFNDRSLRLVKGDRLAAGAFLAAALLFGPLMIFPPFVDSSRAEFEKMATASPPFPGGKVELRFYWQGALGVYTRIKVTAEER